MHIQPIARLGAACAVAALAWAVAAPAHAIPTFARRYETSCTTCHTAFPRLTPFGEAFRRNAYRFPAGGDATAQKQEPLALGNDAQKETWPRTVWPGELPSALPLSLVLDGKAVVGPQPESHSGAGHGHGATAGTPATGAAAADNHGELSSPDLAGLGGHVMLRTGGVVGEFASFFGGIDFGGHDGTSVERAAFILTPADPAALQIKLGRFEPALHGVSIHRGLLAHQLRLTTTPAGLSPFVPEMSVTGAEVAGVAAGRLGWAAGAVESISGNVGWQKDAYLRVEGKLGGMRLDGRHAEATGAAWSERSAAFGASFYRGVAHILDQGKMLHVDTFWRAGVDLHAVFDDVQFDAVVARQHHDQPTRSQGAAGDLDLAFAELSWVPAASFVPLARFEYAKFTSGSSPGARWLASAACNWIARPNVVLRVQADVGADPGDHAGFRNATVGFSTAF